MNTEFRPFIKCRHPTIRYANGLKVVSSCGCCDMCKDKKSQQYISQIAREESVSKYQLFITLTYAPDWLPLYRIVDLNGNHIIYDKNKRHLLGRYHDQPEVFRYDNPLTEVLLEPSFLRRYPKRGTSEYEVRDAGDDYESIMVQDDYFEQNLTSYYKHLEKYKNEYCQTNFEYFPGFIALAPKRDLETFMLRLKNFAVRKCNGATFRYFAVSDYGTNGCLPHWHIILFTDSIELVRSMQPTENDGTAARPSYTSPNLRALWTYGITNISRVEKSCAHYVGGYLNAPANFPRIFKGKLRPRAFHSCHLGTLCSKEVVAENLRDRNFEFFQRLRYSDYQGFSLTYAWQAQDYNQWLPTLPYIKRTNLCNYEQVVTFVLRFIRLCQKDYDKVTFSSIAISLYDYCQSHNVSVSFKDYLYLQDNNKQPFNIQLNLFYDLVLRVNSIYKSMVLLGLDFHSYCDLLRAYDKWNNQRMLTHLYNSLTFNPSYAIEYYRNIDDDFQTQSKYAYYNAYTDRFATRLSRTFKHRDVAERYRFN